MTLMEEIRRASNQARQLESLLIGRIEELVVKLRGEDEGFDLDVYWEDGHLGMHGVSDNWTDEDRSALRNLLDDLGVAEIGAMDDNDNWLWEV